MLFFFVAKFYQIYQTFDHCQFVPPKTGPCSMAMRGTLVQKKTPGLVIEFLNHFRENSLDSFHSLFFLFPLSFLSLSFLFSWFSLHHHRQFIMTHQCPLTSHCRQLITPLSSPQLLEPLFTIPLPPNLTFVHSIVESQIIILHDLSPCFQCTRNPSQHVKSASNFNQIGNFPITTDEIHKQFVRSLHNWKRFSSKITPIALNLPI